jgi:tetratricopeptide (TPR) repeat protein
MESAIGIARRVAEGGGPEQAWGFAFWGAFLHALESSPESIRLLEQARRLDPELAYAAAVLTTVYNIEGEPHLERREALSAERLFRRARGDVNPDHLAWARMQMRSNLARTEGAYGDGVGLYCAAAARGYQIPETYRRCANYRVRNHDAQGARRTWLRMAPDDRPVVEGLILEALIAEARGDGPAEVAAYRRWDLATQLEDREERRSTAVWPGLAVALARGGEQGEAAALAARLPDCYQCLRAKGRVAALGRDWVGAERWLGAAVARAPEIPFAYHDLAEARRARGDLEGARGALRLARKHGPRWADPMKLEGDILAQTGEHRAAIRRYRNAAERAPNWGALHLAWGRSLQALGRDREAAGRYRRATGLDLDAADRAEAVRRLRELGSARA